MPVTIDGQTYYRTAEAYRMLGISRNTLYRWLQKGILGETELRDSRGWRLFTRDEINKLSKAIYSVLKVDRYTTSRMSTTNKMLEIKQTRQNRNGKSS